MEQTIVLLYIIIALLLGIVYLLKKIDAILLPKQRTKKIKIRKVTKKRKRR